MEILQSFIPPGNIIDIGANIGTHSIFYEKIANLSGSSVYAFEANPTSFKCLAHNCKKAIKLPIALGGSVAILNLHSSRNLGSVFVSHAESNEGTTPSDYLPEGVTHVPSTTLDSFMIDGVGYIKIDVEGFEEYVLTGSVQTIMKSRPMIWLEMAPGHLARAGSSTLNVLKQFQELRYFPLFYLGSPLQCDVMMAPYEMAAFCLSKTSNMLNINTLVTPENSDLSSAYSQLNAFFEH